jgi:hypothetical protein
MVLVDLRIEELAEMGLEPFVRALVGSHQPRTTRDCRPPGSLQDGGSWPWHK